MQTEQTPSISANDKVFAQNHATLLSLMHRSILDTGVTFEPYALTLSLERILFDRTTAALVPFEGKAGIEALLYRIAQRCPGFVAAKYDGHLMGLQGSVSMGTGPSLTLKVALGPGGQIRCTVGPTSSISRLLQALELFDRLVHVASQDLGCDYTLLSEGYNPLATSPLDIPLVPRARWTILNAYFGQSGRYARDMMRCVCSTGISVSYASEADAIAAYRLATALSPLLVFLTDNVRSFRGSGARRCPRMAHSVIWEDVDERLCGVVPGTFGKGFSYDAYLRWLEGLPAILFEDETGSVSSVGKRTIREFMEERPLTDKEAKGLLQTALPYARLGQGVELLQADALRPRMAAGYAAFIKGLFCSDLSVHAGLSVLGNVADGDIDLFAHELRMHGWDATVYGNRTTTIVDQLLQIARTALDDAYERRLLEEMGELWDVRMVPRDAFVHQETKASRGW